jgi:hypothetical protein
MDVHPILEEWLEQWVWPTPFRGPGVDFRMRLTTERLMPVWNRIVTRALEGAKATEEASTGVITPAPWEATLAKGLACR